jgi:hypothetical protein
VSGLIAVSEAESTSSWAKAAIVGSDAAAAITTTTNMIATLLNLSPFALSLAGY